MTCLIDCLKLTPKEMFGRLVRLGGNIYLRYWLVGVWETAAY